MKLPFDDTGQKNRLLWEKIRDFPLDAPDVSFPFSRRLARENNWDYDFVLEAIAEYRKFIFLCCISPHGASPSKIVDEVWHLHLIYTYNYWEDFCKQALGRNIHHYPATGGRSQKEKHEHWRADTLDLYRRTFQTAPPPHIWHDNPPGKSPLHRLLKALSVKLTHYLILIPLLLLSGCSGGNAAFLIVPIVGFILFLIPAAAQQADPRTQKDQDGGASQSGSGGGCGSSGCGGGCGGCGGCGG